MAAKALAYLPVSILNMENPVVLNKIVKKAYADERLTVENYIKAVQNVVRFFNEP